MQSIYPSFAQMIKVKRKNKLQFIQKCNILLFSEYQSEFIFEHEDQNIFG